MRVYTTGTAANVNPAATGKANESGSNNMASITDVLTLLNRLKKADDQTIAAVKAEIIAENGHISEGVKALFELAESMKKAAAEASD